MLVASTLRLSRSVATESHRILRMQVDRDLDKFHPLPEDVEIGLVSCLF